MQDALHRLASGRADRPLDGIAPGRPEVGHGERHAAAVARHRRRRHWQLPLVAMLRAVFFRPLEIPGANRPVTKLGGGHLIERHCKLNIEPPRLRMEPQGNRQRPVGAPHPKEAAGMLPVARPGIEPAGVELAVGRVKPPPHDASGQVGNRERHHPPMHETARRLGEHEVHPPLAIRKLEQPAIERRPLLAPHPHKLRR